MLTRLYAWATTRWTEDEGATAVEYGIMVALIAVAIILTVFGIGGELQRLFGVVETQLTGAVPG